MERKALLPIPKRGLTVRLAAECAEMNPHLVDIQNLVFSYPRQFADTTPWRLVVNRLVIPHRSVCRVIGGNMVGKTTLLRILAGLERVSVSPATRISGQLLAGGSEGRGKSWRLRLRNTSFLSHTDRMFPELTIWENVRLARKCGPVGRRDAHKRFRNYMSGLRILQDKPDAIQLGALSSGGQAQIRLARAYTWGAQLILIDEVTAHLDDESAKAFFQHLKILVVDGCSVVLVSHDRRDHGLAQDLVAGGAQAITASIELKDNVSCVTEDSFL